jgi:hypothetical protein
MKHLMGVRDHVDGSYIRDGGIVRRKSKGSNSLIGNIP